MMSSKGFSIGFIMLLGFLLLGLVVTVLLMQFHQAAKKPAESPTSTPFDKVVIPQPSPTSTPVSVNSENTYKADALTFSYPKDWTVRKEGLVNGKAYKIVPISLTNGIGYPKLVIEVLNTTDATIIARQKDYVRLGYRQMRAKVGSLDTTIYATTSAIKLTSTGISKDPVQLLLIHVPTQKEFYNVMFEYEGASASAKMDTFFKDFLSKMTIAGTTNLLN